MRTKLIRNLAIVAAAAAASVSLAGCGGGASSAGGGKQTITFMAANYSDATGPYWKNLVKRFAKANPNISVNLQVVSWSDLPTKVNTLVSTKQTPDILNYNSYASFADDGLLEPMDKALPASLYKEFIPSLVKNGTYKGETYGIPLIASIRALFYNTSIFQKAGVSTPPATWDELVTDSEKIKAAGYSAYGLSWSSSSELDADYSGFMWNNGGSWTDSDGKWDIDSKKNADALTFMSDLVTKYKVTEPGGNAIDRDTLWQEFGQGKIAMVQGANFLPTTMKSQGSKVDYGVAAMPTAEAGETGATLAVEDYLDVFKTTKHLGAVKKFLAFFYQPDNYEKFLLNEGMLPVTQTTADEMTKNEPAQAPFIKMLSSATFYPTTNSEWPTIQNTLRTTMGTAIGGKASPKKFLSNLQTTATSNQ